jgi:hypothetical protein
VCLDRPFIYNNTIYGHTKKIKHCNSNPEDARHLLINCTFAQEVLRLVWSWFDFQRTSTNCLMRSDPANWLAASAVRAKQANVRLAIRILLYSWWNVWKEIFESTQRSEFQVACAVMEDVYGDFLRAMRVPAAVVLFWSPVCYPSWRASFPCRTCFRLSSLSVFVPVSAVF